MQYLISRHEEYLQYIKDFNKQISEIHELLGVLEYNILEMQTYLKQLEPKDDAQLKEEWFAKQQ